MGMTLVKSSQNCPSNTRMEGTYTIYACLTRQIPPETMLLVFSGPNNARGKGKGWCSMTKLVGWFPKQSS